jgi:hypothetical protein
MTVIISGYSPLNGRLLAHPGRFAPPDEPSPF